MAILVPELGPDPRYVHPDILLVGHCSSLRGMQPIKCSPLERFYVVRLGCVLAIAALLACCLRPLLLHRDVTLLAVTGLFLMLPTDETPV